MVLETTADGIQLVNVDQLLSSKNLNVIIVTELLQIRYKSIFM